MVKSIDFSISDLIPSPIATPSFLEGVFLFKDCTQSNGFLSVYEILRSCNFKFESKRCKISLFVSTFELWKIWYALLPKESIVATAIENFSSASVNSSDRPSSSYCSFLRSSFISRYSSGVYGYQRTKSRKSRNRIN